MVGFGSFLNTVWVEDWKIMKVKLVDGKNCK